MLGVYTQEVGEAPVMKIALNEQDIVVIGCERLSGQARNRRSAFLIFGRADSDNAGSLVRPQEQEIRHSSLNCIASVGNGACVSVARASAVICVTHRHFEDGNLSHGG